MDGERRSEAESSKTDAPKARTPELWLRLERALPEYADRKQWLAENARAFEL